MKCWIRVLNLNAPASDGSQIPYEVLQSYIESEECKQDLAEHTMVSSLTHRCRNLKAVFPDNQELPRTTGKDDALIMVKDGAPTITHYITELEIRNDHWLWAKCVIMDEDGLDDISIQNIRRLKGLLKNGVYVGASAVILGLWKSEGKGCDVLRKLVKLKGVDLTLNSSWKGAKVMEAWEEDENGEKIKIFSNTEEDNINKDILKVKAFSDLSSFNYNGPKSSKIDGQFTILKAKQFSSVGMIEEVDTEGENQPIEIEKEFTEQPQSEEKEQPKQKEFTQAGIRDQLREKKMSPRMCFRRMIISYKQVVRSMGGVEKIKPEDLDILKSMLTSDVLFLLNRISNDVIVNNKRINVLLGCSSISKNLRTSAEKLNMIYRLSGIQAKKTGFLQKNYYTKLQESWNEFVGSCINEVFGANSSNIPEEEEELKEEK